MTLYKSHYLFVNFLEIRYLMHLVWTKPADLLDELGYYSEVAKFFNERVKRRGRLILWDFSVIDERVDKNFFDWLDTHILPNLLSVKADKIAYVVDNMSLADEIPQEEIVLGGKEIIRKIFAQQPQAMQWLTRDADTIIRGPEHHH